MARDTRHTEFGGGPGSIGRLPDGSDKLLSVGERARIARMVGIRGDLPSTTDARTQKRMVLDEATGLYVETEELYAPDLQAIAELRDKTNNYSDNANTVSDNAPGLDS